MPRVQGLWPATHLTELKRLLELNADMSTSELATALNKAFAEASYTREAVIGKIHRAKLFNPRAGVMHRTDAKKMASERASPAYRSANTRAIKLRAAKAMAEKKAVELPSKPLPDISAPTSVTNRPVSELEDGQCKWPVSEGIGCGARTDDKRKPYCEHHRQLGTTGMKAFGRVYMPRGSYR
jgi:hypothetical protein